MNPRILQNSDLYGVIASVEFKKTHLHEKGKIHTCFKKKQDGFCIFKSSYCRKKNTDLVKGCMVRLVISPTHKIKKARSKNGLEVILPGLKWKNFHFN